MKADRATGLFWLAVSLVVSVASYQLGLGSIGAPGSGLVPFGAAVLLGLLSVVVFLQAAAAGKGQVRATRDHRELPQGLYPPH